MIWLRSGVVAGHSSDLPIGIFKLPLELLASASVSLQKVKSEGLGPPLLVYVRHGTKEGAEDQLGVALGEVDLK